MDIQYLDGDSALSRISQAPKYEAPPPPPVNPNAPMWYRCDNTSCSQCGCVATASPEEVQKIRKQRCPNNCAQGVDKETGKTCEVCRGRGQVTEVLGIEQFDPTCSFCGQAMRFMQQGPMPVGHSRMAGPEYNRGETGSRRISVS